MSSQSVDLSALHADAAWQIMDTAALVLQTLFAFLGEDATNLMHIVGICVSVMAFFTYKTLYVPTFVQQRGCISQIDRKTGLNSATRRHIFFMILLYDPVHVSAFDRQLGVQCGEFLSKDSHSLCSLVTPRGEADNFSVQHSHQCDYPDQCDSLRRLFKGTADEQSIVCFHGRRRCMASLDSMRRGPYVSAASLDSYFFPDFHCLFV